MMNAEALSVNPKVLEVVVNVQHFKKSYGKKQALAILGAERITGCDCPGCSHLGRMANPCGPISIRCSRIVGGMVEIQTFYANRGQLI